MKLRAQGFSTNRRQGLVGTMVVLTDDFQPTGVEHFGNYSRDADKRLFEKARHAGIDLEPLKSLLVELLKELRVVADAASPSPGPQDDRPKIPYVATSQGLAWLQNAEAGVVPVPLTNFGAQITGEQVRDDGQETQRFFEISATVNDQTFNFTLPAGHFSAMGWVAECLGAQAVIYPGFGLKDHARVAIQLLSGKMPSQRIFTHTGWRKVNGLWVFLSNSGAIGPAGRVPDVNVELPDALQGFRLPEPPTGEELRSAIRMSLEFLNTAGDQVTVPIYCAVWRAVLGGANFSPHVSGATGTGKTELAALAQQHFGPDMDALNLPGNWSSTPNALEALAFAAKDVLLVVDDFAPTGTMADIQRAHRDADRLLRAQGNRSSRQRMNADSSLRPPKPPRGLILSTGEDIPRGQSLRSRLVVLDLTEDEPGAMNWEHLTLCQDYAATGKLALAMSGFLRWLAPQYGDIRRTLRQQVATLAEKVRTARQHRRTSRNEASLAVGLVYFLRFAVEVGALSSAEVEELWRRTWRALGIVASSQGEHQRASEPVRRFLQLLAAVVASGRGHVAGAEGTEPFTPESWGWRQAIVGTGDYERTEWRAQGLRIGWVQGDNLYLEADAAYAEARRLGREEGGALPVTLQTLKKRLKERGLLASTETYGGSERLEVRRTLEGNRRTVIHLNTSALMGPKVRQVRQVHHHGSEPSTDPPGPGAHSPDLESKVRQESEPKAADEEPESLEDGADGALGALSEGISPGSPKFLNHQDGNASDPWDSFLTEGEE